MTVPQISATDPDWSREAPRSWWDPSRKLLRTIRRYQAVRKGPFDLVIRKYWALQHKFWSMITQCEIHLTTDIGGGLMLPHPNGIVIHPGTKIGPNCMVFQQVTFGALSGETSVPVIGGHVDIGAGAKVLGGIAIGDHAVIGANAVVLQDVPPGAVAVGVPARIIRKVANTL